MHINNFAFVCAVWCGNDSQKMPYPIFIVDFFFAQLLENKYKAIRLNADAFTNFGLFVSVCVCVSANKSVKQTMKGTQLIEMWNNSLSIEIVQNACHRTYVHVCVYACA